MADGNLIERDDDEEDAWFAEKELLHDGTGAFMISFRQPLENQSEQHNDTTVRSKCSSSIGSIQLRHTFTYVKMQLQTHADLF